jgi:S1-C subfamily serine protease
MNDIDNPESQGERPDDAGGDRSPGWPPPSDQGAWGPPSSPGWQPSGGAPGAPRHPGDVPPGGPAQPPPGGGWTPPPPPPDWSSYGWRDPGAPPSAGYPYGYWQAQQGGWGPPGPGAPPGPGGGPGGWYGWSPARPRRTLPSTVTALLLVVAVLVGLGIGHGVWSANQTSVGNPSAGSGGSNFDPFGNGGTVPSNGFGSGGSGSLSTAAAAVANDLVDIDTTLSFQNDQAAGTGIVLTADGYILTNNHVISGATSISVTDIGNGQKYTATVVGYDRTHDVAVIKLQGASGLRTAPWGNSSRVQVGEGVVGLGNAGGVGGTPSSAPGQVTALAQSIKAQDESNGTTEQLTGLIQTNCNIQPGDSGGALVDSAGQVVGMDTAASAGFSFETQGTQGFAIPINQALSIASQIRHGKASSTVHIGATAFLGVEVDTSPSAAATRGAVVSRPIPGGAAASAGITAGSVIVSLGGATVDSSSSLTSLMEHYHPGDRVSIGWTDPTGRSHTATVTLANGPAA